MSISTDLYATLNANAGVQAIVGRGTSPQTIHLYPSDAPESASVPFIVYEVISGTRITTISGVGDMANELIQMSCFDSTADLARALADAAYDALEGDGHQRNISGAIFDETTREYMVTLDWSFLA